MAFLYMIEYAPFSLSSQLCVSDFVDGCDWWGKRGIWLMVGGYIRCDLITWCELKCVSKGRGGSASIVSNPA